MDIQVDVFDGWHILERELPRDYREQAKRMGLIHWVPPQLNAKVTDGAPLLRLLLDHARGTSSLELTTARAAATGVAEILPVALHKWERKAAPWLAALVGQMVQADGACTDFEGDTVGGYRVVVVDGTSVWVQFRCVMVFMRPAVGLEGGRGPCARCGESAGRRKAV